MKGSVKDCMDDWILYTDSACISDYHLVELVLIFVDWLYRCLPNILWNCLTCEYTKQLKGKITSSPLFILLLLYFSIYIYSHIVTFQNPCLQLHYKWKMPTSNSNNIKFWMWIIMQISHLYIQTQARTPSHGKECSICTY